MVTKQCFKCKRTLSSSEFGKDKWCTDGLTSWCKECNRAVARAYRRTPVGKAYQQAYHRTPAVKAYQQAYHRTPEAKAYYQAYRRTPVGKAINRRNSCNARLRYPEKRKARNAITSAINRGDIPPASTLPCSYCTQQGKVTFAHQYHHYLGYELEHHLHVIPLCRACHKLFHSTACVGV